MSNDEAPAADAFHIGDSRESVHLPNCSDAQFRQALEILVTRPHSANKWFVGAKIEESVDFAKNYCVLRRVVHKDSNTHRERITCSSDTEGSILMSVEPLTDVENNGVANKRAPASFSVCKSGSEVTFRLLRDGDPEERKSAARRNFSCLVKWCGQDSLTLSEPSLRLVDLEKYQAKYNRLKDKYGRDLIANWPEGTDAKKFVHEDLGIAAYLSLLWEAEEEAGGEEDRKKISFVDLGCGNGLLVYILGREGYKGTGLDVRKRKIWDHFGKDPAVAAAPDLRVKTVVPSEDTSFPDADWLLGNHSDELTPWIPVMAAKSSPKTKFWVLPCCPFEFKSKFQRRDTDKSSYRDYLDYVRKVSETCGFAVEEDKMRIPSTKRICFVGRKRNHLKQERDRVLQDIRAMLTVAPQRDASEPNMKRARVDEFVRRDAEIAIRNCTQIDKKAVSAMVGKIVRRCLEENNPLSNYGKDSTPFVRPPVSQEWNAGGCLPLSEVVSTLDREELALLKSQCGGLQTLLRNHAHVFVVVGGSVRLRCAALEYQSYRRRKKGKKTKSVEEGDKKKRLCWFHENHPQGCSVAPADCEWAHGESDLIGAPQSPTL